MLLLSKSFNYDVYFLLNPNGTQDCYYFESNQSLVLHTKVLFIKQACNMVL